MWMLQGIQLYWPTTFALSACKLGRRMLGPWRSVVRRSRPFLTHTLGCVGYVRVCGVCEGVWGMWGCVGYVRVCGVCEGVWGMWGCVGYVRVCGVCEEGVGYAWLEDRMMRLALCPLPRLLRFGYIRKMSLRTLMASLIFPDLWWCRCRKGRPVPRALQRVQSPTVGYISASMYLCMEPESNFEIESDLGHVAIVTWPRSRSRWVYRLLYSLAS